MWSTQQAVSPTPLLRALGSRRSVGPGVRANANSQATLLFYCQDSQSPWNHPERFYCTFFGRRAGIGTVLDIVPPRLNVVAVENSHERKLTQGACRPRNSHSHCSQGATEHIPT